MRQCSLVLPKALIAQADVRYPAGLKSGLAVGSSLCAPIIGFVIIRGLTKLVPHINWLGGPFGPRETAIVNAAAVGAAGTAQIFTSLIPGMFKLKLLTSAPSAFGPLLALSLMCTFGGLFAAAPLRGFFIVRSARELRLRFPECEFTDMVLETYLLSEEQPSKGEKLMQNNATL